MLPIGETACLAAASLWAVSLMLFRDAIREHGARTVNLVKCVLAALLQGATVLALGQADALGTAPPRSLLLIGASGLVGLVLGDTALFAAVTRIGVHRTLLLQTLSPVFAALIAALWQGERPSVRQSLGAAVVLAGVALVVAPSRRYVAAASAVIPGGGTPRGAGWAPAGVLIGAVAALGQGAGVVLAKVGMEEVPVLPASFLRLAAAGLGLLGLGLFGGRLARVPRVLLRRRSVTRVVPATLLGTYLALFLMMAGLALTPTAVAAVLLSTSPVFSLVLEALVDRQPVTLRGVAGTLLAVAGVAVLGGA